MGQSVSQPGITSPYVDATVAFPGPSQHTGSREQLEAAESARIYYRVVGRQITLEECQFIFTRIWDATIQASKQPHDHAHAHVDEEADHIHLDDDGGRERDPNEVHLSDVFHIVDLAGKMMNKQEPHEDDETPYDEFMKHAHTDIIQSGIEGDEDLEIQYVSAEDVPSMLLAIFIGQPDEKRMEVANLLSRYSDQKDNKFVIEHIIDQIWAQYDADGSGALDRNESFDFIKIVLEMHEKISAKKLNRDIRDITKDEVETAMELCDTNHDGMLSKDEMNKWIIEHMNNNAQYKAEQARMHDCSGHHHGHGGHHEEKEEHHHEEAEEKQHVDEHDEEE